MKTKPFVSCLLVLLLLPFVICAEGSAPGDRAARPTPAPHTHRFVDWHVETAATCTEPGLSRAHCSACGANASQAIPALGHDWGEWGYKGAYLERACGRCGMTQQKSLGGAESDALLLTGKQEGNSVTLSVTNTGTSAAADVSIALTVTDEDGAVLYSSTIAPEEGALLESGRTITVTTDLPDNPNLDPEGEGHGTLPASAAFLAAGTSAKTGSPVSSDPWNADLGMWKVLPAGKGPDATFELVVDKIVYTQPEVGGSIYVSIYVRNAGTEDMKLTDADFTWESANKYPTVKTIHYDEGAFAPGETNEIAIGYGTVTPKDRDNGHIDFHFGITGRYAGSDSTYSGVVRTLSEDLRVYVPNPTLSQWDNIFSLPFNTDLDISVTCDVSVYEEGQDVPLYLSVRNAGKKTIYAASSCGFKYDPMPLGYPSGEPFLAYRFYPGDVVNKTFHYTVTGKDIEAGEFSFMFYAYGAEDGSDGYARSESATITLKVKPTASISLVPVSADEANYAGQSVDVDLLVSNTGNDDLTGVTVSSLFTNASYAPVPADPAPFTLPPHESRHVHFSLTVLDQDLDIAEGIILRFKAEGTPSHGGDNVSAQCQVLIDNYRKDPPVPDEPEPAPHKDPSIVLKGPAASDAVRFAGQEITVGVTAENPNAYGLSAVYVECIQPDAGILPAKDYGTSELGAGKEDAYTFVYTVAADDLAKPYVTIKYTVSAQDDETGLSCSAELETWIPVETGDKTPDPVPDAPEEPDITLSDYTYSSAAGYAGQEIVVGIRAANTGGVTLEYLTLSCLQEDSGTAVPAESAGAGVLLPNDHDVYTFRYTVTPEDMTNASIPFRFDVMCFAEGPGTTVSDSYTGSVPVVPIGTEEGDTDAKIELIDLKASDCAQYEGQVITLSAKACDPSPYSLKDVAVTAENGLTHAPVPVLAPGAAALAPHADTEYTFEYTVKKEDLDQPSVTFLFRASAKEEETGAPVSDEKTLTIDVKTAPTKASPGTVTVEKAVSNKAKAKDGRFEPYETIDFTITITNGLPYDVTGFIVYDTLAGGSGYWTTTGPVPSGSSTDVYFPYAPDVTECGTGVLLNQAAVQWMDPDTGETKTAISNVAKADLYLPKTASATGDPCCVRMLVSAEGGALVWRTDACPAHAKLLDAGTGAEAEAAWLEAIGALYDGMLKGADEETAAAIRSERDAWSARHEALGRLLPLIVPDGETAQRVLTEDAMLRCTDLCCEAHTAPAPRADIAESEEYAAGINGSCSLAAEKDGKGFTLTLCLCASHGDANDLNALQKEAGDRVRLLQYALSGGDRSYVNALRSAQADWFAARSALLNILYDTNTANAILAADARLCISQVCAASSNP